MKQSDIKQKIAEIDLDNLQTENDFVQFFQLLNQVKDNDFLAQIERKLKNNPVFEKFKQDKSELDLNLLRTQSISARLAELKADKVERKSQYNRQQAANNLQQVANQQAMIISMLSEFKDENGWIDIKGLVNKIGNEPLKFETAIKIAEEMPSEQREKEANNLGKTLSQNQNNTLTPQEQNIAKINLAATFVELKNEGKMDRNLARDFSELHEMIGKGDVGKIKSKIEEMADKYPDIHYFQQWKKDAQNIENLDLTNLRNQVSDNMAEFTRFQESMLPENTRGNTKLTMSLYDTSVEVNKIFRQTMGLPTESKGGFFSLEGEFIEKRIENLKKVFERNTENNTVNPTELLFNDLTSLLTQKHQNDLKELGINGLIEKLNNQGKEKLNQDESVLLNLLSSPLLDTLSAYYRSYSDKTFDVVNIISGQGKISKEQFDVIMKLRSEISPENLAKLKEWKELEVLKESYYQFSKDKDGNIIVDRKLHQNIKEERLKLGSDEQKIVENKEKNNLNSLDEDISYQVNKVEIALFATETTKTFNNNQQIKHTEEVSQHYKPSI